jgi:coproporphyrinogen III oxidase
VKVWLTSLDGRINYPCEADTVEAAFDAFAVSVGFKDWAAFSADSGYSYKDVTATRIVDERKSMDWDSAQFSGDLIRRERESAITAAYRWLLRQ